MAKRMSIIGAVIFFSGLLSLPCGSADNLYHGPIYSLDGLYSQLDDYFRYYCDPRFLKQFNPRDLRGHFSITHGDSEDLYGSSDMVYTLYILNELEERTTPEGRKEWAKFLQSCQDPETGWFTRHHRTWQFKEHATAYAIAALDLLGDKPLYPLSQARSIAGNKISTQVWLSTILWSYVWVGSHQGGGMPAALEMTGEAPDQFWDWYFGWLDREANPETGLWQRAPWNLFSKKPLKEEMAGAPHFYWVYQHKDHPLPYPKRIIDSSLSLQLPNGLWDTKGNKGLYSYCVDFDAIYNIHHAWQELRAQGIDYRTGDIKKSFDRYLATSVPIFNQPGSLIKLYPNSHKSAAAPASVAEAENFFIEIGEPRLKLKKSLNSPIDRVPWL